MQTNSLGEEAYSLIHKTIESANGLLGSTSWNFDMEEVTSSGQLNTNLIVSTFTTPANGYADFIKDLNGDIHGVPRSASVGIKFKKDGTVETYSLVYTTSFGAHSGGILAPDGTIYFVPYYTTAIQKIDKYGVVSTIAGLGGTSGWYYCGCLAPNGEIHFIPHNATVGLKISLAGVPSTYALPYTTSQAYLGGVLGEDGYIHCIPNSAAVGMMISPTGTPSTYALAHTTSQAYSKGVLDTNGEIHFIPSQALVGQKVNTRTGVVSTYSMPGLNGSTNFRVGGCLLPSGDVLMVPEKATSYLISKSGIVTTMSYTSIVGPNSGSAAILDNDGNILYAPWNTTYYTKNFINPSKTFSKTYSLHYMHT